MTFSNLVLMEGTALYIYLAVQSLVLLNVTLMALDVTRTVRANWEAFKKMYSPFRARKKRRTEEEVRESSREGCLTWWIESRRLCRSRLPHGRFGERLQHRGCR